MVNASEFSMQGRDKEISVLLEKALKNLSELDLLYENGSIEEKRKILGSIFPEKLTFDGVQHRTTRINEVLNLIYRKNGELNGNKKGTNLLFSDLSHQVITLGSFFISENAFKTFASLFFSDW